MRNNKLKSLRALNHLTQQDFANAVGVSRQTIYAIEKGEYNPTLDLCIKICKFFGVTLNDLFWEE